MRTHEKILMIAALLGCFACQSAPTPPAVPTNSSSDPSAGFSGDTSTGPIGGSLAAAASPAPVPAPAASTAAASNGETLATQMQNLNNQINADEGQLEIALQSQTALQGDLANVQTQGISNDTGNAIGSGLAGVGEVALGVLSGNIFADIGGAASLGSAIGSGIGAAQTSSTVGQDASTVQSELDQVNTEITNLKADIAKKQAQVTQLVKEGASG